MHSIPNHRDLIRRVALRFDRYHEAKIKYGNDKFPYTRCNGSGSRAGPSGNKTKME